MITVYTWIELYLQGYTLEWSLNFKDWFPITEEPFTGDGKYYRREKDATYFIPRKPQ